MRLIFLILFTLSTIMSVGQPCSGQRIILNGVTTIHITRDSVSKILPISAQVYHVFPAYDFSEVNDSMPTGKGQIWLQCPVRVEQEAYLLIQKDKIKLFMVPGDTIHIHIISPAISTEAFHYRFEGKTKDEQAYYLAKKEKFPIEPGQMGMNAGVNAKNLILFQHQLDSLTQTELLFWQEYRQQHALPAWFVRFESDAIRYNDAMLRLYMTRYQTDFQHKKQTIPATYFTFLKQLPVRNSQAQYNYVYLNFLEQYIGWKLKSSGVPVTDRDKYQSAFYPLATQTLGRDLGDFFRLRTISYSIQTNPERARTELDSSTFPAQYQYLAAYLHSRSEKKLAILQRGDKAPTFFLQDTCDSLVSLNQFKGQIVYLCFWFAGCGGCQKEYPYENQLVDQFQGKPVQIVSICTITKPDKWRATIKKEKLKTTNLLANPAWQKTLEEKYAISVYPHYVLIGADGRIIENFATRPSQNAATKITAALAELKPE